MSLTLAQAAVAANVVGTMMMRTAYEDGEAFAEVWTQRGWERVDPSPSERSWISEGIESALAKKDAEI